MSTSDNFVAKQFKEDQHAFVDPKEGAMKKAVLAGTSTSSLILAFFLISKGYCSILVFWWCLVSDGVVH